MKSPALAAITMDVTGGGVAVVSRLLWMSFQKRWGTSTELVTMFDHETRPASFVEKCRFATTVVAAQTVRRRDFMFFAHVGLARVQNGVPAAVRRPYGVFIHGIEAWNELTPGEEMALRRANLLVANSTYTAKRVKEAHPWLGLIEVCPLALPSARADAPPARERKPARVLVVGRMASAERYKGHDQLLKAWPAVVAAVPQAVLVIAGGGDDVGRLRSEAARAGLNGSIEFAGFVNDDRLAALYRDAAVFALPSRGEGFGLVYLEAMAHGLPCVGSICDAAREVIVEGETGRLIDPDSTSDLAATLIGLLSNEDERCRMGQAGLQRAQNVFSAERFHARMGELLASAAPRPPQT